jgi:hypothetical protein
LNVVTRRDERYFGVARGKFVVGCSGPARDDQ